MATSYFNYMAIVRRLSKLKIKQRNQIAIAVFSPGCDCICHTLPGVTATLTISTEARRWVGRKGDSFAFHTSKRVKIKVLLFYYR